MSTEPAPAETGQAPPAEAPPVAAAEATPSASPFGDLPQDLGGYVENKGWKNPSDVISAYKNLEGFRGVPEDRLVKLPEDPAQMGEVWDRLGRPEKVENYTLALPEEMRDGVYDRMATAAHSAGLTDAQFQAMQGEFADVSEAIKTENADKVAADFENWQAANQSDFNNVRNLMNAVGISADDMSAAMNGDATAFYSTLAKVASRMGEKPAPGEDGGSTSFEMSPAAAQAKVDTMNADPAFQERLNSENKQVRLAAAKERRRFLEIAHRDEAVQDQELNNLRRENSRLLSERRRNA